MNKEGQSDVRLIQAQPNAGAQPAGLQLFFRRPGQADFSHFHQHNGRHLLEYASAVDYGSPAAFPQGKRGYPSRRASAVCPA